MPSLTSVTSAEFRALRAQVDRLERQMRGKATATPLGRPTTLARNRPPKIAGLRSVPVPGQIGASWSQSSIPDLAAYEVEIALDASFSGNVTQLSVSGTSFTRAVPDPSSSHWVRVRARSQSTGGGDWSDRLELESGLVLASDMAPDAATSVSRNRVESFYPPTLDSAGVQGPPYAEYGSALASTYNGVVFVFVRFQGEYDATSPASLSPWRLEIGLLRDGQPTGDTDALGSNTTSFGTVTLGGGLSTPDEPGTGDFVYSIGLSLSDGGGPNRIILTPSLLEIELVEFMRARG